MQLAVWTYEGPPHVGAMRVATALTDVHYVLHAPQGDTYADLLFTMIERRDRRPPVSYSTFASRDLSSDTASLFQRRLAEAYERFQPAAMLVGASCTGELIQDDPAGLAEGLDLPCPVIALELPSYQRKENWGASETLYQLVRGLSDPAAAERRDPEKPSCNILGPTALGFRHRDDVAEIRKLIESQGIAVNLVAPLDASAHDLVAIPAADFNVVLYPEIAEVSARWLERQFGQKWTRTAPIGVNATIEFIHEIRALAGLPEIEVKAEDSRLPWYSRSVDSNYLTGKRVFVFGDATHALAAARVASEEFGFEVCGLGTYTRERARDVREAAKHYGLEALITDDHLEVEDAIAEAVPELLLGTQMERHIGKKLGIGCAVISAPVHVQDHPARYSPQMGFEGANVLWDSWVHPLVMGLEEHLLGMFREDFEFNDGAQPSHLGHGSRPDDRPIALAMADGDGRGADASAEQPETQSAEPPLSDRWTEEAERELKKIPFFVRGKARRNTEAFAAENGIAPITLDTLYEAKAHYAR